MDGHVRVWDLEDHRLLAGGLCYLNSCCEQNTVAVSKILLYILHTVVHTTASGVRTTVVSSLGLTGLLLVACVALKLRMQLGVAGAQQTPDSTVISHSSSAVRLSTGPTSPDETREDSPPRHSPVHELDESV